MKPVTDRPISLRRPGRPYAGGSNLVAFRVTDEEYAELSRGGNPNEEARRRVFPARKPARPAAPIFTKAVGKPVSTVSNTRMGDLEIVYDPVE